MNQHQRDKLCKIEQSLKNSNKTHHEYSVKRIYNQLILHNEQKTANLFADDVILNGTMTNKFVQLQTHVLRQSKTEVKCIYLQPINCPYCTELGAHGYVQRKRYFDYDKGVLKFKLLKPKEQQKVQQIPEKSELAIWFEKLLESVPDTNDSLQQEKEEIQPIINYTLEELLE